MKMIFESMLLDKVQEDINKEIKEKTKFENADNNSSNQEIKDIISHVTFEWFKVRSYL